jgi:hypothetical protein
MALRYHPRDTQKKMTHSTQDKTARDSFTKCIIAGTLVAILGVVISVAYYSYRISTAPTRDAQESLEDYHRATEELRRLQQEAE